MRKSSLHFKKIGAAVLGGVAAVHVLRALTRDRVIEHHHIRVRSDKIGPALKGYRIAFITDTHYVADDTLKDGVHQVRARRPDLLLLGGDFAHDGDILRRHLDILKNVNPRDGIYGVSGNHDKQEVLQREMETRSMKLLSNTGVFIKERLYLCGTQDILKGKPDTREAAKHASKDDFTLLLSHNPDVSMQYSMDGIDLMLSGHTHGGQMSLFGVYAPALSLVSDYGQKFRCGAVRAQGKMVYVSRGVGNHRRLFRVFAQPEVVHLTLEGTKGI